MKDQIGILAGDTWKLLKEKGEQKISSLPKLLDQKPAMVYMALGWLAREDNITFTDKKNVTYIDLSG